MSLPIRPPLLLLCPPVLVPPPIWGGTSPPPYHQGLGKTLTTELQSVPTISSRVVANDNHLTTCHPSTKFSHASALNRSRTVSLPSTYPARPCFTSIFGVTDAQPTAPAHHSNNIGCGNIVHVRIFVGLL